MCLRPFGCLAVGWVERRLVVLQRLGLHPRVPELAHRALTVEEGLVPVTGFEPAQSPLLIAHALLGLCGFGHLQ